MNTLILTLAIQCFFPIFEFATNQFAGMSIVNTDPQSHVYDLTHRDAAGKTIVVGHVPVPPDNVRAVLLSDLPLFPASAPGWILMDSPASDCPAYMTGGDTNFLIGIEPAMATATTLIAPFVEVNTGFTELNYVDTSLAVVNPSGTAANVGMQLFGLDGALKSTVNLSVPAMGSRLARISELFNTALPANSAGGKTFSGYLRLTSITGIAAWERFDGVLSESVLRAKSPDELTRSNEADFPHFVVGGSYASILNVMNPTSTRVSLEMTAVDDRGSMLGERINVSLGPGEALRDRVETIFRFVSVLTFPPPLISGSIRIRETSGQSFQLAGNVEISNLRQGGRESSLLSTITASPARTWILPFAASTTPYFTGYAIQNPNTLLTVQTDVVVEIIGVDGVTIERTAFQISPGTRTARLMTPPGKTGFIRITANFPVQVFGAIGTTDGRTLEAIPAFGR